jgi:two-component system, NtrC family, sensor kinase
VVDSADEIGVLAAAFNAMLAQLRDANRDLETRVEQRTSELSKANGALQSEMERRLAMELELRQAQKLESVGRLAAGVAHEINTPVQFAADSCNFLGDAIADLKNGFDARAKLLGRLAAGELAVAETLAEIEASDEQYDVHYLVEQIPKAVERVIQGCARVAKIVAAMKEFAYADQGTQTAANLNRAIESTLVVSSNEYKYVADMHTELGELPPVVCQLGELNQVFLNIVVNAAHAIEAKVRGTEQRGTIRITTAVDHEDVVIEIADDGCGIPTEIIDKVFDPFFTTKEIGKGTGQGLAIARSVIVDKHRGALTVASTPNAGTTFTIRLPIAGHSQTETFQEAA